jgi:hypothetical protein
MAQANLGTLIKKKTKLPYKPIEASPAYQEQIILTQQIIKGYELFLLDQAYEGNENAMDALLYANVMSTALTFDKVGGMIHASYAVKDSSLGFPPTESKETIKQALEGNTPPVLPDIPPPPGSEAITEFQQQLNEWQKNLPGGAGASGGQNELPDFLKGGWFDGGTDKGDISVDWTDKSFDGTVASLLQSNSLKEGAENFFADCIPCGMRLQDLAALDPFGDLLDSLLGWLQDQLAQLMRLYNMINDPTFLQEICSLLDLLNFNCVPDLMAMLALLQYYVYEVVKALFAMFTKGGLYLIWSLISPLFIPIFSDLEQMIDMWLQTLLAPINCIIGSVLAQINKLGGPKGTGIIEGAWRTFSPGAYRYDPNTGAVIPADVPQHDSEWQKQYYRATLDYQIALEDVNRYRLSGETDKEQEAISRRDRASGELRQLGSQAVPTVADENAKRASAIKKIFNSSANKSLSNDLRAEGFKSLDAEGWLILFQKLTTNSLYYAANYLVEARNAFQNLINKIQSQLLGFLQIETNSLKLKALSLQRLKEVMRLINMVATIIDIVEAGKLVCEDDETPSEASVYAALVKVAPPPGTPLQSGGAGGDNTISATLINVLNAQGENIGYTITSPDFDPITGGYVPLGANGESKLPESITVTDPAVLANFIPPGGCFKTSSSESKKIKEWLAQMVQKSKEYGIVA